MKRYKYRGYIKLESCDTVIRVLNKRLTAHEPSSKWMKRVEFTPSGEKSYITIYALPNQFVESFDAAYNIQEKLMHRISDILDEPILALAIHAALKELFIKDDRRSVSVSIYDDNMFLKCGYDKEETTEDQQEEVQLIIKSRKEE